MATTITKRISNNNDDGIVYFDGASLALNPFDYFSGYYTGYDVDAFMRFTSLDIPTGAVINSAKITLVAVGSEATITQSTRIYGNSVDDATSPATAAEYAAKSKTTAYVDWTMPAITATNAYDTPDLKTIIQEIVDRPGWVSGNDILILHENVTIPGGDMLKNFVDHTVNSASAALLTIEYDIIVAGRHCLIDSEEILISTSWSISDKINARSTMSATVIDKQSATIDEGSTFQMFNGATKIFEGIILRIRKYEEMPGVLYYDLDIVDNSALADKRVIAKVYENELAGDIVKDFITEILTFEDVTEGIIQDGPIIKKAVFNYRKVSEALDYIKKITGLSWNIDKDKKLNFFDRETNVSPYELNNTVQHVDFEQESNMDDYRNTQYVRGGKGKTAVQEDETLTPKPDGKSRNFVLRFQVAEKPIIETNLNGAGWVAIDPADIGINGLDKNKKWYHTYGSNILTQDDTEAVLVDVDNVRSTYTGLRNLFVKIEGSAEVADRATKEGNSGIYERLIVETSISGSVQAIEFGEGLIRTYGEIKDTVSFRTEVPGLEAGQLLRVNKSLYGINDDFLIESINITPADSNTIEYNVSALDGAAIGGWEEFFKELLKGNRDYAIAENEVIILLFVFLESVKYEGLCVVGTTIFDTPRDDLYPATDYYPIRQGSETIND